MKGAQLVVQSLRKQNVNIVFGYPGGAIMPIYDALFDGGIEHLLCRHEQGAIIAAIGYAKAIHKTGVCIATSGPGATNLITGLADALLDSVPIVAITGQVETNLIGTDAFQEVDILGLSLSCTKHSFLVKSIHSLSHIISEAFNIANHGRPGPVLIDIPKDIQLENIDLSMFDKNKQNIYKHNKINIKHFNNIKKAKNLISLSKKPILYIGGGVGISKSVITLRNFIKKTQLPSVSTLKGLGAVDSDNKYYLGMLGMHGNQAANLAVQYSDLLIVIGARFDDRATGKLDKFAPKAKVIHLDIDPSEFNKLRQANVTLLGNLNDIIPFLNQTLNINSWQKKILKLKKKYAWKYDHPGNSIYAPTVLKIISELSPNNTIITTDVGQHQMWVAQHMTFNFPENFITSSGLGTMGFGIPAAIGAQIACPYNTVICISGDGSFMMNIQELATIKRKLLPLKIVLFDNQRLGMVRQWQQLFFNKRYSETTLSDNPNFLKLAKSFSIPGIHIHRKDQIINSVKILLKSTGSFLLHISINELENVWPLVIPGSSNDTMLEK
ncbi:MAG: acetolactate synthase 2 catalytic subunit [Enterobacterales bacterium]